MGWPIGAKQYIDVEFGWPHSTHHQFQVGLVCSPFLVATYGNEKLQSVAKWIGGVESLVSWKGLIPDDSVHLCSKHGFQWLEIVDQKGDVRLLRRPEFIFDTKMNLPATQGEPDAPEALEVFGLFDLGQAKKAPIEFSRRFLSPSGHRQQDMINISQQWQMPRHTSGGGLTGVSGGLPAKNAARLSTTS